MNNSGKVALCGIITALCLIMMILTEFISIGTYALPMLAGMLLLITAKELEPKWSWMVFAAASILSIFFVVDKEAVFFFVLFFGYYPVLKTQIERLKLALVQYILKFCTFNAAMVAFFYSSIFVLKIPKASFVVFGQYLPGILLIIANLVFILYDKVLARTTAIYVCRWRRKVRKILNLKD